MINRERIMRLLSEGRSTNEISSLMGCSRSSVIRLANGFGHDFKERQIQWDIGDEMIREGYQDHDVSEAVGCSISSARRRRTEHHGLRRRYNEPDPSVDYKKALEETFIQVHQKYFQKVSYQDFRQWCKTQQGQDFLDKTLNVPERYSAQKSWDVYSYSRRQERHGASA